MDRQSILAIVLITVIIIVWMVWMSVSQKPPMDVQQQALQTEQTTQDQQTESEPSASDDDFQTDIASLSKDSLDVINKFGKTFMPFVTGKERLITIENDVFKAILSSKGAVIKKFYLKEYKSWDQHTTQLINAQKGVLGIRLSSREIGGDVDTRDLFFEFEKGTKDNYTLRGNESVAINLQLKTQDGRSIIRKLTFYGNTYHFDTDITINKFDDILTNKGYKLEWLNGLRFQESNSVDESNESEAMVSLNREIFYLDASEYSVVKEQKTGTIDYAAIKTKYFTAAIKPIPEKSYDGTVTLSGQRFGAPDNGIIEKYDMSYMIPYRGGAQTKSFQVYIGPIHYDTLSEYGMQDIVNLGWKFIIRPIGEFFMLPFFLFIYKLIGNYGISIILFSIVMKILLHPLSIQQMRSAQKMQIVAPEIAKVREKFKDDQKTQQQEIMKVYSTYGINPAGGCLPLLLQMPILYALWSVLRTSIDLRQADFIWWITDLSLPDSIVTLPFPIFGITSISGLALAMGITMFIQQKMTMTDPKQKALVYMMPIMFTLLFSYFPSGLNLYYFMFNLLGILQQTYINKFSRKKLTLEDLKRMPKKEGWLAKKMREAQDIAQAQGKSLPGQKPVQKNMPIKKKKKK